MRYINTEGLVAPPRWLERARRAQTAIAAVGNLLQTATEDQLAPLLLQLKALINRQARLWSAFKGALQQLSDQKCWYCEAKQSRSDMMVDHFRPKNEVRECKPHHGYWWLALEYSNFRLACNLCNSLHENEEAGRSLGKSTRFPLMNEANRVFNPAGDLMAESPSLLDPTSPLDPSLLSFLDDGTAAPAYSKDVSAPFFDRATISIDAYNLNDQKIKEERFIVAQRIKREVSRAERYLDNAQAGEPAATEHFLEVYRTLLNLIARSSEFSAAARAILAGYKDKAWVVRALTTA